MTRTNTGKITEDDIELPEGLSWDVELGSINLSRATRKLFFSDSISQSGEFDVEVLVDPGDIAEEEKLIVSKEGVGAFNGVVKEPQRSSQGADSIKGGGAAELLRDIPINGEYLDTNTVDVVNNIFSTITSSRIQVGVNEELSDGNGNVDIRADDEGALSLLNRVISSHGGEWYTSYDAQNDQFEFNVVNKLESGSVQKTFTEENTIEIKDNFVVDEKYDAVVVKGYGDGEDQIKGEYPERSTWPDDPRVLKYTDKTILSPEEATNTAQSVYDKHTEWRNIYVYPSNMQELLNLGDQVTVQEPRTGLDGTFRVVDRTLSLDFNDQQQIEYVLSDKPLGIVDEAEDVKEQTKSQTDYMQGSRNVWGEKETRNCSDTQPLTLDVEIPQDVVDKAGNNRIQDISVNYRVSPYKQDGSPVQTGTLQTDTLTKDTRVRKINLTTSERTDSVGKEDLQDRSRSSAESFDSNAVEVEKSDISDHNHPVASSTADSNFIEQEIIQTFATSSSFTVSEGNSITLDVFSGENYQIQSDPFFISIELTDSSNTPGDQIALKGEVQVTATTQTFFNQGFSTGLGGDVKLAIPVDEPAFDGTISDLSFELYNIADGSGDKTFEIFGRLFAPKSHDHAIPRQSGGASTGAEDQPVNFEKKNPAIGETSNFKSSSVTATEQTDYVVEVTENTSSSADGASPDEPQTVEDLTDEEVFRLSSIDPDVLEDGNFEANEVTVAVEDPDGNTTQIGTFAEKQKNNVDITDAVSGPGDYKIIFEPDQLTHLKGRAFLDHHKDSA